MDEQMDGRMDGQTSGLLGLLSEPKISCIQGSLEIPMLSLPRTAPQCRALLSILPAQIFLHPPHNLKYLQMVMIGIITCLHNIFGVIRRPWSGNLYLSVFLSKGSFRSV